MKGKLLLLEKASSRRRMNAGNAQHATRKVPWGSEGSQSALMFLRLALADWRHD